MNATTLLVVWMGGKQVLVGDMPVGNLTAFTTYIVQVLMSLMMLAMVLLQSSRAIASAKRINEVLDTEIDLTDDRAGKKDALVQKGRIEFRGVSFRYYKESQEKVLDDINLTIEPGQTVGIIGSTGCGKTTLVSMIPRLYDADEGSVLVDGVDVRDYSLKNLRNGVGMVLQKNVLFSGTIEENLMWGDEDASEEEVIKASEAAQAAAFLQTFPDAGRPSWTGRSQRIGRTETASLYRKGAPEKAPDTHPGRQYQRRGYRYGSQNPGKLYRYLKGNYKTDHSAEDHLRYGGGSDCRNG